MSLLTCSCNQGINHHEFITFSTTQDKITPWRWSLKSKSNDLVKLVSFHSFEIDKYSPKTEYKINDIVGNGYMKNDHTDSGLQINKSNGNGYSNFHYHSLSFTDGLNSFSENSLFQRSLSDDTFDTSNGYQDTRLLQIADQCYEKESAVSLDKKSKKPQKCIRFNDNIYDLKAKCYSTAI